MTSATTTKPRPKPAAEVVFTEPDDAGDATAAPAPKRRPAAKRKPAERVAPPAPLEDAEADDDPDDDPDDTIEGVIVSAELTFTTPKKNRPAESVAERSINFKIDDEVFTIIRPAKLQEAIAGLIESGARRANESDVLFAGTTFLRKVLAPASLARINQRLDDDADDFEITDLFDNLERIALALIRSAPAAPRGGPVPARRRAAGR